MSRDLTGPVVFSRKCLFVGNCKAFGKLISAQFGKGAAPNFERSEGRSESSRGNEKISDPSANDRGLDRTESLGPAIYFFFSFTLFFFIFPGFIFLVKCRGATLRNNGLHMQHYARPPMHKLISTSFSDIFVRFERYWLSLYNYMLTHT